MFKRHLIVATLLVVAISLLPAGATADGNRDIHQSLQTEKSEAVRTGEGTRTASSTYTAQETDAACWTDPGSDTRNMSTGATEAYPKADLVQWCGAFEGSYLVLEHRNATPTSPTSDPNWVNGLTGLLWDVDVNGDHQGEYGVYYMNNGSQVVVEVERYSDGAIVCGGEAIYTDPFYTARIDPACVGNPSQFWADAFMMYDSQWDNPDAPVYADISDTFGGPVSQPSSTPPPSDNEPQPAPAPDDGSSQYFSDVTGGPHVANIDFLYERGLVNGCGTDPLRYCPGDNMTRAQMASILARYIQQVEGQ